MKVEVATTMAYDGRRVVCDTAIPSAFERGDRLTDGRFLTRKIFDHKEFNHASSNNGIEIIQALTMILKVVGARK